MGSHALHCAFVWRYIPAKIHYCLRCLSLQRQHWCFACDIQYYISLQCNFCLDIQLLIWTSRIRVDLGKPLQCRRCVFTSTWYMYSYADNTRFRQTNGLWVIRALKGDSESTSRAKTSNTTTTIVCCFFVKGKLKRKKVQWKHNSFSLTRFLGFIPV
jgi:hypothetical protein